MRKVFWGAAAIVVLAASMFVFGLNRGLNWNLAEVDIVNKAGHAIMTATINHEKGSAIAANIKRNKKERVRFFTKGINTYSLRVTFDNNTTLYSEGKRIIKNGEIIIETIGDSAIVAQKGK